MDWGMFIGSVVLKCLTPDRIPEWTYTSHSGIDQRVRFGYPFKTSLFFVTSSTAYNDDLTNVFCA
jgi:hypothetical protein